MRLPARILVGLLALPAAFAQAGEGDTLRPFVTATYGYDSNIFRFADDNEAFLTGLFSPPGSPLSGVQKIESVTYRRYGAGLDLDWKQGRQAVTGRVSGNKTSFSRYADLLDYSGRDIRGEWKWALGNRWSGLLSGSQVRSQAPYTNQGTGTLDSNLRSEENFAFQADYWFHTDWRARARVERYDLGYSEASQQYRDRTRDTLTLGLYRLGNTVTRLGTELVTTQGEPPTVANSEFDERALRLVGEWTLSGKTRLTGRLGYIQRTRTNPGAQDYSGPEWRFEAIWSPSGKSLVQATLSRDLRDSELGSNFFEKVDSLGLSASWQVLPKVRLQGSVSYDKVDAQGILRNDDVLNASLSMAYEIWRGGEISLGYQRSSRDSSSPTSEYDSNALFLNANLIF